MASSGKRAGTRKAPRKAPSLQPGLLGLAGGVTVCVVAWGYLVYAAVDFGSTARGGDSGAWLFLALASVGAIACLFVGLMLVARLLRRLGITKDPGASSSPGTTADPATTVPAPRPSGSGPVLGSRIDPPSAAPRPVGGRRAAR